MNTNIIDNRGPVVVVEAACQENRSSRVRPTLRYAGFKETPVSSPFTRKILWGATSDRHMSLISKPVYGGLFYLICLISPSSKRQFVNTHNWIKIKVIK